ncbi:MAG: amino acid adenylation domain-containing protein [Scytonema sp. PMC 1069.18]|nr:amino acid adenylation domain-containing protein [Scytonema sp. PMC 1069.18]MEC4882740.1 amino acid adenylation domain-containing protein [Scytonema sp. PMC 1070.18]
MTIANNNSYFEPHIQLENQLNYWKQQLAGANSVLELPGDKPRPLVQNHQIAKQSTIIPKSLSHALLKLSQQEGVTLFTTMLAVFQTLLYRYSGQEEILVGSPVTVKDNKQTGWKTNILVLRTDMSNNPSFRELLQRVRTVVTIAETHKDLPFEKLIEELEIKRSPSHHPLFQVMFVLQDITRQTLELPQLTTDLEQVTPQLDLTLAIEETEQGLHCVWEYNTDLFYPGTIERIHGHFQTLLEGIVTNSQQITELPLLTANERQQILEEWNHTQIDYPQKCIHQLFEQQVEQTPDAVAVVFEDKQLTYWELNKRANQLAHYLKTLGVKPDDLVGICVERSLEMVVGLLAILKAGGAYVPLDPAYPQERINYILSDAQVSVLLTNSSQSSRIEEDSTSPKYQVVSLDKNWENITTHPIENPTTSATKDNLAYVIYTSGSTGKPKGVQIQHGAVVNFLTSMQQQPGLTEADVLLAVTTISFDIAALELYLPLITGARVVVVTKEVASDGRLLSDFITTTSTTVMQATPATWRMLLAAGWKGVPGLKILCGGEALTTDLAQQLSATGAVVWNMYGPTETTIWSTVFEAVIAQSSQTAIPIGRPIANTQVYLLDQHLQPVPIGVFGELHIGGDGLARGYLNRPELTNEKFIPNPFSREEARLYKTGDLARYLPDGNLEYIGRIDHQVKIRGFRIELGEIETVLRQHSSILQAVAIAREDNRGDKRLVAYVVVKPEQDSPSPSELRQFLKEQLPEYMVPVAFVCLETLPLTPNGKIDRRALPEPYTSHFINESSFVAPRNPSEEILAAIWSQVLGLERVGIHDNFFELGGHSLLATQVISRIRQAFSVEIPLHLFFETPTIAGLVQAIASGQNPEQQQIIPQQTNRQSAPLSYLQQQLWFLAQLDPNSAAYNIVEAVKLQGDLNISVLQSALDDLVAHHLVLRTNFVLQNDNPVQIISEPRSVELKVIDLKDNLEVERIQQLLRTEAQRPFNLASDLMLRACVLVRSPQEHILLLVMHHIATDGWSMNIFFKQLAELYQAKIHNQPNPLPELPIQYIDFAVWQNQQFSEKALEKQLNYWQQQLAGATPVLELPTDRPRPPVQTYRGARQYFTIPQNLSKALDALSRKEGVTLFMTLLAAFQTLLYRYSRQQDILIGSPIAGRNRAEVEDLIGFFVNTLVMRADLSGNPSFQELLQRVRTIAISAYAHQDLSFEKLVQQLRPERSLSYHPLFQVMFVLQNLSRQTLELPGLNLTSFEVETESSQFDLLLEIKETEQGLKGLWEYNTDLFDDTTIIRLNEHFQSLLNAITVNPEQKIAELPLLTTTERNQLLEWNNTQTNYPQKCIHQLFEEQVERTPDAVAVVFEDQQLTYAQLNTRANQLAHHLSHLGVKPNVLVGICMERSLEMVIGLLGILKAGGAYVPLDPEYPQERLTFIADDTQTLVMLTQQKLVSSLPTLKAKVICLDSEWEEIAQHSQENFVSEVNIDNLIYVIYTSGSTGTPKGVMIPHRGICNTLHWRQSKFELTPRDKVLQTISLSFDPSVWQIFWPLSFGGQLIMARPGGHKDPAYFIHEVVKREITILGLVPSIIQALVEEKGFENCQTLRHVTTGGEPLSVELMERFYACLNLDRILVNCYGPTEASIDVTTWVCQRGTDYTSIPIGQPIANVQVHILDENLQPVPIGHPGELYIGGAGLALGYLNRPELTQERFISHPWSQESDAKLYKTGDLVRYLPDGNIEFIGRIDHQVKVRGFRIELGEIEATLGTHPALQQTLVMVRKDVPGDKGLVAYFVPHSEQVPPNPSELRGFLQDKLPDYMIPSAFVLLDTMPLNPNGKVDRRALPAPDISHFSAVNNFVAPRTPTEEVLATIWTEVLGLEQVGINDNFFELGGHSLLATRVISRVRQTFSVEIAVQRLFESPTIAGLASAIASTQNQSHEEYQAIIRVANRQSVPLSFAQQRLWFLEQLEPNSATYHIPEVLWLQGDLNIAVLQQCLDTIVAYHEVLRTNFIASNGEPVQMIGEPRSVELKVINIEDCAETEYATVVQQILQDEIQRPFNLASDLMLRGCLLVRSPQEHILLLVMHHIASDGWSMSILFSLLATLYEEFINGSPKPLLELPIQYADYAVWQRQWLLGEVLAKQLDYWKQQLAGANTVLELPTDRPRPPVQSYRGAKQSFVIPQSVAQTLSALSRQEGATLFMVLLAAFQTLLYRYNGQEDILVGSPIAGRNRQEVEGLIGFFVNTLVLRTDMSNNPSFSELLQRVRQVALSAYSHQDLPFEKLVEELQPERSLSYHPLFQVMFVLQNAPKQTLELPRLTLTSYELDSVTSKFDLTLSVVETEQGLQGDWEYSTDLFDAATIQRMSGHFQTLLQEIGANPQQSINELPLLTPIEKQQFLVWNETQANYSHQCIHQLFEEQVKRTPDTVAVVYEDQQLTYQELNQRANQLAHYLKKLGVSPEIMVGICVERSPLMIVGLLGILKAGGAYVPIAPTYPQERIAYMLQDAQVQVLLTQTELAAQLPEHNAQQVCLDADWQIIAQERSENPTTQAQLDNLAYVIYTSGSTGKPKGVAIQHRSVINLSSGLEQAIYTVEPNSPLRVSVNGSFAFDTSVKQIIQILHGHTLDIVPEDIRFDGDALLSYLIHHQIEVFDCTPSQLRLLISAGLLNSDVALKSVLVGGEAIDESTWQLLAQAEKIRFYNVYGPTECTVDATICEIRKAASKPVIGRPIANTQVYILDHHLQPVPIGVPGELHISGAGLARCYLNRPEITQDKFIVNPFNQESSPRLYKTGDLVRYLPDGNIEYLGRIDDQVKIRGFRIELGEIEAILSTHPAVKQTLVIAREDIPGDKRLVAYVVVQPEQIPPSPSELRGFLKEQLPDYMVPTAFVFLEVIPLTPNGKIDRRALPVPDASNYSDTNSFVAPRTPTEETLAAIWVEVLGLEQVSIYDNFFDLGGHSLLATQVMSRIRQSFDVNMSLRQLFETPTIAELADGIIQLQTENTEDDEISHLLAELEDLSDEEAQHLLAQLSANS